MSRFFATPAADAAVEIAPEAVSVALVSPGGAGAAVRGFAVEPVAPGAVTPALTAQNIGDRRPVVAALRTAIDRVGVKPHRVSLVVPDAVARVTLVRFERVPARREDLDQLVRWQVRKAAPFSVDEAAISYVPGAPVADGGQEFLVVLSRRDIVREYEAVCEEAGMHPGLVDLSTFGLVNLLLAAPSAPPGDWLVVHARPTYVSLVILREGDVIFFRNISNAEAATLADLVHQTSMYHQDRLSGAGFTQVLLGGVGRAAASLEELRRNLEARLGTAVQAVDPQRVVSVPDRGGVAAGGLGALAPALGSLLRMHREAAGVR